MRFVDTSFWIALLSGRDRHHAAACALATSGPGPLLTTNHVVGETWTFVRRRHDHASAVACVSVLRDLPDLTILTLDEAVEDDAWRWLKRRIARSIRIVARGIWRPRRPVLTRK